jgi:hypothetical protein
METYIIFGAFALIFIGFFLLYKVTKNKVLIRIKKKYIVDGERFVVDGDNIKYKINHSVACLWNWHCMCDNLWNELEENFRYDIEYHGINAPLIGSYYHIIRISN